MLRDPGHLLALGFGSGLAPKAPGTFGTLIGVVLFIPLGTLTAVFYGTAVLALYALGVVACGRTADALGVHDHGAIVWDEVVGFLVAAALCGNTLELAVAFVLFRIFDIVKPWPIKYVDSQVSGGTGIMLDDVIAGLFCLPLILLFQYFS
ncbi:MAG: phosphatidylglycerophosphatase A [Pseudomonadota bacterium]